MVIPEVTNMNAVPQTGSNGTTVAASASLNTKGSWTQLLAAASVTYDVFAISLIINNDSAGAVATKNLYDIGIGGAGSEVVLIPNILNTGDVSTRAAPLREIIIPCFIPRNTRISARKQSNVASKTSSVQIILHGAQGLAPLPTFQGCDSYGTDVTTSGGLSLTPGASGTYSAWTNIGATLTRDYKCIIPLVGTGSQTAMTNIFYYMQLGVSSTAFRTWMFTTSSAEDVGWLYPEFPLFGNFKSGDQMQVRATGHTTSDNLEFGFLALY
ncbi:MAG: hypothetical protein ABJA10_07605 [Aestuariivirga sp.]